MDGVPQLEVHENAMRLGELVVFQPTDLLTDPLQVFLGREKPGPAFTKERFRPSDFRTRRKDKGEVEMRVLSPVGSSIKRWDHPRPSLVTAFGKVVRNTPPLLVLLFVVKQRHTCSHVLDQLWLKTPFTSHLLRFPSPLRRGLGPHGAP